MLYISPLFVKYVPTALAPNSPSLAFQRAGEARRLSTQNYIGLYYYNLLAIKKIFLTLAKIYYKGCTPRRLLDGNYCHS
jgi:hypothetical protein